MKHLGCHMKYRPVPSLFFAGTYVNDARVKFSNRGVFQMPRFLPYRMRNVTEPKFAGPAPRFGPRSPGYENKPIIT
jgi:hypothetical protein